MPKPKKRKPVNFRVIPELDNGHEPEPYKLLKEVRDSHHSELYGARIALAWRLRQKADKDGHMILGKCVKTSDLSREFADYDFIVVLNEEVWESEEFDRAKKVALLDHELCHAAPSLDEVTSEHKQDERGRLLFRIRKHDIEEFQDVVSRHGCYKKDLERFARVLLQNKETPLFKEAKKPEDDPVEVQMSLSGPGIDGTVDVTAAVNAARHGRRPKGFSKPVNMGVN